MKFIETPYFGAGKASDLEGKDRLLYRIFEILPGFLSWGSLLLIILSSIWYPVWAAIFIILFDAYWLLKTVYMSIHLRYNHKRLKHNMKLDWQERLSNLKYEHVWHVVILPFYNEGYDVVEDSIKALLETKYDKTKVIVVLASEERAGDDAQNTAQKIIDSYGDLFSELIVTKHPKDVEGEMAGKGSNISYAAEQVRVRVLDPRKINYEDVLVSAFDIDTVAYPQYFLCLTWNFLTCENPHRTSFQPVPLYNNNIWQAPSLSRVMAMTSTFWQMIQQERPEKLATFSSHSVMFKTLYEIGYWQKNMVSEDSRIFWNLFLAHDGDYRVIPIAYPVSMDANLDESYWKTVKNVYKQHRRWSWGVENIPYILMGFVKNKRIKLWTKIRMSAVQLEGFWSLATNPIFIFLLGWLPLVLGGHLFASTVLSYNLPRITRDLMSLAMLGLVLSAAISISLLPKPPKTVRKRDWVIMWVQWIIVPITITIFGAIPGLDAQMRLMLGKYMGFWVTPKHRK
jgi:hypothetical protein